MAQDIGTPVAPLGDYPVQPPPKKSNRTVWIIVIVVAVVLCCCCVLGVGGYYIYQNGDQIFNQFFNGVVVPWLAAFA